MDVEYVLHIEVNLHRESAWDGRCSLEQVMKQAMDHVPFVYVAHTSGDTPELVTAKITLKELRIVPPQTTERRSRIG